MRKSTKGATKKPPKDGEIYRREKVDARNKARLNRCNVSGTKRVIVNKQPFTYIHIPIGLTKKQEQEHIDRYRGRLITI